MFLYYFIIIYRPPGCTEGADVIIANDMKFIFKHSTFEVLGVNSWFVSYLIQFIIDSMNGRMIKEVRCGLKSVLTDLICEEVGETC